MISGGKILVKALAAHGVDTAFCVAGESYLPVLDGFLDYPDIQVVTCRHESGVTFMAESYANLTGRPGIALATRGPGACNASIGVHAARQSSTPMIFLVGLIATTDRDKEAFQEFDIAQMFDSLAKWATVIERTERIPEYIARAFHVAMSGRPGPVVLGLPEDVLFGEAPEPEVRTIPSTALVPTDHDIAQIKSILSDAERPLVIVGGGGWSDQACADLSDFAGACHLPVSAVFRRHDIFNHNDSNYIGELGTGANPKLIQRVKEADVILALGARLDEITTQSYTLIGDQKIIHVHPDPSVFGQSCIPALTVQAHFEPLAAALAAKCRLDGRGWAAWRDEARRDYLVWSDIDSYQPQRWAGADMTEVFRQLRDLLPEDAIISTDAGNFSGWCQRYLRYARPGRMVGPVCGAMGYGVPAAIAASLAFPGRIALGVCGDGGFLMSGQELATAVHHGAKPIIMVCNNSMYGTIRMHQEKTYPGRISATSLTNPDFVKFGESFGAFAARVERAEDFTKVWQDAVKSNKPALIEIRMDPRQITTNAKV